MITGSNVTLKNRNLLNNFAKERAVKLIWTPNGIRGDQVEDGP